MIELILTNGNIISLDDAVPRADTLVIRHDRIVYAGGAQGTALYGDPRTAVIDLAGKTVVPGFNDNHLHAISTGNYFSKPNLLGLNIDPFSTPEYRFPSDRMSRVNPRSIRWN